MTSRRQPSLPRLERNEGPEIVGPLVRSHRGREIRPAVQAQGEAEDLLVEQKPHVHAAGDLEVPFDQQVPAKVPQDDVPDIP